MGYQQISVLNMVTLYFIVTIIWFKLPVSLSDRSQSQCTFNKATAFVNCRNKNLTSVPANLPPDAKIVDLSGNNIQYLEDSSFKNSLLITELYLANNNISSINYATFGRLKSLKILDVSDNKLSHFHTDLPVSLEVLYLNGNPLSSQNIFQQRLLFIRYLSLARTQLKKPTIFSSFLPVLQFLDLQEIPELTLNVEDLYKLRHLRILYVSPRMFSGRTKNQTCHEFIKAAREYNVEVKAFTCSPQESFEIKGKTFERVYQVNEAMYDHRDNIILNEFENENENTNETCLHDLQTLVSNGVADIIKSVLVEYRKKQATSYKVKEPLVLENIMENPEIGLFNVNMTGYPVFKMENKPLILFSTVDAEEYKRFMVEYATAESKRDIVITGNFNVYDASGTFTCKFTNTNYETKRHMLRRYDFQIWPTHIREKLRFEKMDCTTSLSNNHVDKVIDMVLTSLSKTWLSSVSNFANAVDVDSRISDIGASFVAMYRESVLRKLIDKGITYLKNLNINSFDVSPSLYSSLNGPTAEPDATTKLYNIKIENLFNYWNTDLQYSVSQNEPHSLKLIGKYIVHYKPESTAILIISSKDDPTDVMNIVMKSIEFDLTFEVKSINEVQKLNITDVNVTIEENKSERVNFVFSLLKKYLGVELAKELKRSLIFLTDKVDFYNLNVL